MVEYLKAGLGRLGTAQLVVDDIFNLLLNNEVKYDKMFTVFKVFSQQFKYHIFNNISIRVSSFKSLE